MCYINPAPPPGVPSSTSTSSGDISLLSANIEIHTTSICLVFTNQRVLLGPRAQPLPLVSSWPSVVSFSGMLRLYGNGNLLANGLGRYDTGTISGILAMDYWIKEFATNTNENGPYITAAQSSLIVSILSAGTFFGALTAAPFGDLLGRRWGLIASCAVFSVGVVFQTAATATALFALGRFIAGYGVGLVSALGKNSFSINNNFHNFNKYPQFHCTNLSLLQNGFVVPSSVPINWPSPLVSFLLLARTRVHTPARTLDPTGSQLPSSFSGLSFSPEGCSFFLKPPVS